MAKFKYITTAIDYVNSLPHIGTAYEKIGADVLARLYRLRGYDVMFQMGNDEHSANVQKAAKEKGMQPKAYCDDMRPKFEDVWNQLHISNDQFIQTSEPRHHKAAKKLFQTIFDKGDIYLRDYEGWYCDSCEAFYTDKDLEEGLCKYHKTKPEWIKEQNYFFKLSVYQDFLLEYIESNPNFILPAKRRNEVLQFIRQGLQDVSVSRSSFDWGIPLPVQEDHVIYVWFDALINYITGLGYGDDDSDFEERWKTTTHIIGKDITRFHCVIWPAMLKSAGISMPKSIVGHGFVYLKGEKMSKSLGNVVTPLDILKQYPEFGADALRYYLLRGSSFGDDGDFTWDNFIERYNADLANGYGNLLSRTLGMVWRYQDGKLDPLPDDAQEERLLLEGARSIYNQVLESLDVENSGDVEFHHALEKIWSYITRIDQYIDQKAPWTLSKEQKSKDLSVVLSTVCEAIRIISIMVYPFVPDAVEKAWDAFNFNEFEKLEDVTVQSVELVPCFTKSFYLAEKKAMLFPRIQLEKKENVVPEKQADNTEDDNLISIDDFFKSELKIAEVKKAELVEGADKLLCLQVEIGKEKRQIVAGIAKFYSPEDLVGKKVVVVTNLKPAEIRGVESRGMLLAAKKGKKLVVVSPDGDIASGAKVG